MRAGGGKQKGAQFERDVCKQLSLWVSGGQREDLFWRSAMSGGRATLGKRAGKDHAKHAGDISATHPLGHLLTNHFYIECKFVKSLDLDSWMLKSAGALAGYWRVACEEAAAHGLEPMMIVKQNQWEPLMIVRCTHQLTPNATGLIFLNPRAFVARLMRAKADIYNLAGVLQRDFKEPQKREQFLKPGEVEHILAKPTKRYQGTENAEASEPARSRAQSTKPIRVRARE